MSRRRAVLAGGLLALAGCARDTGTPHPAPLTGPQAETLALMRFTNYRAGAARTTATIPLPGRAVRLDARLDWRAHTGYGLLSGTGPGASQHWRHLLRWDRGGVRVHYDWPGAVPAEPPEDGWAERDLQPDTSAVDTALALLTALASDRPENAQLLARSGARRLGTTTIGGHPVTEFSGPAPRPASSSPGAPAGADGSRTRYWIDSRGTLRRFAARLPGTSGWMTADLTPVG
ncbi:hypothetical protein [Streptomyces sp. NPDC005573]|uniref:hypothetical protein n=1 Tax=Streptomyces sp. NPDC005573 TaxID=3156890 RepID=UPI0033A95D2A